MKKNIVICCDGTGNQLNETYSNVVKLFMFLVKDPDKQLVFYDPGVGTMSDPNVVTPLSKSLSKIGGLVFGWGLRRNVSEAYTFLMNYYTPGDHIYLFGFSRGAYCARVLAAMLHAVGLLQRGSGHLFPYAWKAFTNCTQKAGFQIASQFKATYCQKVSIHFMGLWDTVSSVGVFGTGTFPFTAKNNSVLRLRHAMAIDEKRCYYRQNLFTSTSKKQDIKQVWFAGAHSDIGGSYGLKDSGLSQVALRWMVDEAIPFGLYIDNDRLGNILYDKGSKGFSTPDPLARVHPSLSVYWWPLEILPRMKNRFPWIKFPTLGRTRELHMDSMRHKKLIPVVHASVMERMKKMDYKPKNLFGKPYRLEAADPGVIQS